MPASSRSTVWSLVTRLTLWVVGIVFAVLVANLFGVKPIEAATCKTQEECSVLIPPGLGLPTVVLGNVYEETAKKVDGFMKTLVVGGMTQMFNALQTFTQRIAYDVAQSILTGDPGQYPLWHQEDFGEYLKNVGRDTADQLISDINSDFFEPFGFGLCTPVDPWKLSIGLMGQFQPPAQLEATCTVAKIAAAFEQTKASFNSVKEVNDVISVGYDPNASELGVSLGMHGVLLDRIFDNERAAQLDRQESEGLKQVKNVISGKIDTPSKVVEDYLSSMNFSQLGNENVKAAYNMMAANAFELGFTQIGVLTASTFVNTLASGLLQKVFKGITSADLQSVNIDLANSQSVTNRNLASARIVFSDLLTPNLISNDQRDFVIELSGCPSPRGLWNCAMDESFAAAFRTTGESGAYTVGQASHVILNGEPPKNPAFLHKDWELIPESEVKDNTDSGCYQRAYCASNLAKLRYARVIPVGWELAANSPYNTKKNGKYITLEEVIRGFSVCNDQGEADAAHPWCKLIDPNWVLTAPPFQCRVKGHGDTVFGGTGLRLQECADAVSCLQRDDRGKCIGGYGYCIAEKPVWRFNADQCLERFASCRTYQTRDGQRVSYLRNTIDYGSCSADDVGCLAYVSIRNPKDVSGTVWQADSKVYFDATAKPCSAADDGCTRLLEVRAGQSALNLVQNGSFELGSNENDPNVIASWDLSSNAEAFNEGAIGGRSLELVSSGQETVAPSIAVSPLRTYSLTVLARAVDPAQGTGSFTLELTLLKSDGAPVGPANMYRSQGCSISAQASVGIDQSAPADETWRSFVCTFVSNPDVARLRLTVDGENALIDGVQLEEAEVPTAYVEGAATDLKAVHLKLPPEELVCEGDEDDHPLCAGYARMCRQSDAGCQGYRDIDNPFSPEIPATLSAVDFCPNSCVGYAEYRKQPSTFDLGQNADPRLHDPQDQTSAVFIPSTAAQCTIQDVGCEEFTNVQASAQGGEQKAYFNYVRACEKPNENTETYFTWEGSDTTGYQLRTWSLIHDASQTPAPPKLIEKAGPEGILKEPSSCNDLSWATGVDPDCRQIFNANGDVFYAYLSQTVVSSPACTDFRKNASNAADCGKTGGSFNASTGECLYSVLPAESRTCRAQAAGCRAYMGTAGRNTAVVLDETFRTTTGTPFTAGELSNESILVGDQSLKLTGPGTLETATIFPSFPNQLYRVSFWAKTTSPSQQNATLNVDGQAVGTFPVQVDWRRYEFGPFGGVQSGTSTVIGWANLPNATFIDEIRIERLSDVTFVVKDSWVTPAICDRTPEGIPEPQAMLGCRAYTDRDGKSVTVRRFGHLCREASIGCKAFVDTRNSSDAYRQDFTVEGTATNTKVTPVAQAWEDKYVGSWTATRPADRYVYAIDEPRARCDATRASCRAFGKPVLDPATLEARTKELTGAEAQALGGPNVNSFTVGEYQTVYFMDDVTQYVSSDGEPNMLCRKDELFCDEFKSGKTVAYFRNPFEHACEWRDKVLLKADPANGIQADGEYTGWFRVGTNVPCYPDLLSSGGTFLTQNAGDPTYTGWVSTCPVEQSECTEFRDPNDHSDPLHPAGKQYFFIKNQRLDLKSCNGRVDLLSGCVLFRDLTDPRLRYSTDATYGKSHSEGDVPQTPIDCVADPDHEFCKSQKTCKDVKIESCIGIGCLDPKLAQPLCVNESEVACNNPVLASTPYCEQLFKFAGCTGVDTVEKVTGASCQVDADCTVEAVDTFPQAAYKVTGTCGIENDANVVMKVRLDRDCSEWLGCATAETVFDQVQQKYVEVCTEVAMCNLSKGANAGSFCGNYVDRSRDPVMKPGVFFDRSAYTKREVGFGEVDYSGYAIPDQFQAADIQNRKVGQELFAQDPNMANKFAQDYRLVAAVPRSTGLVEFSTTPDQLYPTLRICTHTQTGRTGYYINSGDSSKWVCYFAIDALSTRSVDVTQVGQDTIDPRNIQPLSDLFRQATDLRNDIGLQRSFPPAECKAYPEGNSPFSNLYVEEWDFTTQPFRAKDTVDGYESATLCEYGEDCACSYRRVKYGSGQVQKYYSPFGIAPPGGICSGGQKDGQACVPGEQSAIGSDGIAQLLSTTEDVGCPGGGRCLAISDVVLVRGQFGQCLQRDYSRSVAGDPGRHPCLIWNPNPILASSYDLAHFNPMAGYTPPVNAGEYYCLSQASPSFETIWSVRSRTAYSANEPDKNWSWVRGDASSNPGGDGANPFFHLPGKLSKFNYDVGYIGGLCHNADECEGGSEQFAGGKCNCHDGDPTSSTGAPATDLDELVNNAQLSSDLEACLQVSSNPYTCAPMFMEQVRFTNLGIGIDGKQPYDGLESPQAERCMRAFTDPDPDLKEGITPWERAPQVDYNRGRWIMTGRGLGRTYMEYFVAVKPQGVAEWLSPGVPVTDESKEQAMLERNFAQFQFFPVNDSYAAACSIPPEYVEGGVSVQDWSDMQQVQLASNQVFTAFSRDFDGQLDRSKEQILTDGTGKPIKETCSGLNDGTNANGKWAGEDGRCYYKYWETDYRMDGTRKFEWLDAQSGTAFYDRRGQYFSHERTCPKSGFAIRALFENANKQENDKPEDQVDASQLTGPWNFIGFWITACKVGDDFESSLFLSLRVKHADICREIGQVISPYSRESAAFADRVWAGGSFVIPQLGYSFATQYAPYGSALVNGIPGIAPLFQTGGPVENWSPLKPPTFLGAGATYVTQNQSPLFKWAHLTNIFARVYRVYEYQDAGVGKRSWACIDGPKDGIQCPSPPNGNDQDAAWLDATEELCGGNGTCNTAAASMFAKNSIHRCNGLSGVNAGLECGGGAQLPSLDPVCHNAPMKKNPNTGIVEPQYTTCELRTAQNWQICPNGQYSNDGCNTAYNAKSAHEQFNAFGCGQEAVQPGSGCSTPSDKSVDCPLRVDGGQDSVCVDDDLGPMYGHCSNGYEHARCITNADCSFTMSQWWGAYDDGVPKNPYDYDWGVGNAERDLANQTEQNALSPWVGAYSLWAYYYPTDGSPTRFGAFLPFATVSLPIPVTTNNMADIPRAKTVLYDTPYVFTSHSRFGAKAVLNTNAQGSLAFRYPSAHESHATFAGNPNAAMVQPGLCEGAAGAYMDPNNYFAAGIDPPQGVPGEIEAKFSVYDKPNYALQVGVCAGGVYDGQFCYASSDTPSWSNPKACAPPANTPSGVCKAVADFDASGAQIPIPECNLGSGDAYTDDPDADNNSCTRTAGYAPRRDLCAGNISSEKCLVGYDLVTQKQTSLGYKTLAPTDVTSGFHKPSFLGLDDSNPEDERHIGFYAPRPPTIAAPDLTHSCEAPGRCKISSVGAFSLENQSAGPVIFGGGKAQVTMRFYGWAAHEQTPLKSLYIDWGDGSVTKIDEARLKNKKPFCGVTRECELVPGLTCQSDSDCPAAGGKCSDVGSCSADPKKTCFRNADCQAAGNPNDTCNIRPFFGNSKDACEANYFEFTHAYSCDPLKIQACRIGQDIPNRCSRNPDVLCDTNADCGVGDVCMAGLAPSSDGGVGGCYDDEKVACKYTPKVMLVDSWNWCTGECRSGPLAGNQPTDDETGTDATRVRHVYGGCWNGTETKKNVDINGNGVLNEAVMLPSQNECNISPETDKNIRPWVVYPGAVQIGVFQ